MIAKKIFYTHEHKESMKRFRKELIIEAQYIGEEGDMVCVALSAKGALKKFQRLTQETLGDIESKELTIDGIGHGWMFLVEKDDKNLSGDIQDCEWYVNYSGSQRSDYPVWVYSQ